MNKIESHSSDLYQKAEADFCANLVSEIEKLAIANHQEDILNASLRRIDSLISWNEAIPPHLSTLKKYIRTLIRKILFTAIRNCYNYDFPYIADQASKLTQAETTAAPQGEQWQLLREGTTATPYRRKTNEMVTSHFKSKTMKYSCYEPQNYRNYNYAAYFVEHCIPRLIEKKPEFSLVFSSDSQEKITEEYVRIAKLHGSKNPANTRVTAPKILNTPPSELCQPLSGDRKKIWNALEQANFQNIYIIYHYMFTCKDDSALLSFLLQMLAMEFCGGREHTSPKKHTAFGSPYESIEDLRHQYFLLQEQCFILQDLCHWLENEFSISWNG